MDREDILKNFFLLIIGGLILNFPVYSQLSNPPISINEIMTSNGQTIADEAGEYEDWIEIFNNADSSVALSGFYLTDDLGTPKKWPFPDTTIASKGFLLIWADENQEQGPLHANFKLNSAGETIALYDGTSIISSITYGQQKQDYSYGCYPNGSESGAPTNWYIFITPTPSSENIYPNLLFAGKPIFSHSGGFYQNSLTVELAVADSNTEIRYTLDCSNPTEQSNLYSAPLLIDTTTVIRARTFGVGYHPGETVTNSYLIDQSFQIGVVSLVTEPKSLWDADSGLYLNPLERGKQWERAASIELFENDGSLGFASNIGFRMQGGYTRKLKKKSFRCYFRSEYGQSKLEYPLFNEFGGEQFKRFLIASLFMDSPSRPASGIGTLLKNAVLQELGRQLHPELSLESRPVALFLNGQPWGLYNIFERIDKYLLEYKFGITNGDIIDQYEEVLEGTPDRWKEMLDFFQRKNLSTAKNFEIANSYIDLHNFTRYNFVQIWGANDDWPARNNCAYRSHLENDKWKWILWDLDKTFNRPNFNAIQNAIDPSLGGTVILRKLLENYEYKVHFVNLFSDAMNSVLSPDNVIPLIDSLASIIRNDIDFEVDRWGYSINDWENNVDFIKSFAENRNVRVRQTISSVLGFKKDYQLTILPPSQGEGVVRVNSLNLTKFPWQGFYFRDIPIELEAKPAPGYTFVRWSNQSLPLEKQIVLTSQQDYSVYPIFQQDTTNYSIVINEINYKSAATSDSKDWIELYNNSNKQSFVQLNSASAIVISGWRFRDGTDIHDFVLPPNTILESDSYLVLCQDTTAFTAIFPGVTNYLGNFDFGLARENELIQLFN